jgi:xylose isomerase
MRYATRLNSFVAETGGVEAALREIAGTGRIEYVDLNYPEHFEALTPAAMADLLSELGLRVNSIAMRYRSRFLHGEFTNRDAAVSREAIALTKEGIDVAARLGCDLVTVWLGFDGVDYTFQKDYPAAVAQTVAVFQELADHRPDVRLSIEYKPYEERVYALNGTAGMTLYLLEKIDRPNVGATLDFCHMLMTGDLPGFGAAMLLSSGKLWGVHLNDGNNRVDDGLMIGSVHPWETAEFLYYLLRYEYQGVIYFDTFPKRERASAEAVANADAVDLLVRKVEAYGLDRIEAVVRAEDGIESQRLRLALLGS